MVRIDGKKHYTATEIMRIAGLKNATSVSNFMRKRALPFVLVNGTRLYSEELVPLFLARPKRGQWRKGTGKGIPAGSVGLSPRLPAIRDKYRNGVPEGEVERWIDGVFNVR